jgi:hypothetical protein
VGDVLAIGGKVVKFLAKVPRHFDDAVRLIARWDKLSEEARTGVLKVILLGAHADLRTVGLSDSTILKLAKSDRNDLRALAAAARSTRRISGPQIPFQRGAAAGERAIRDLLGDASTKGRAPVRARAAGQRTFLPGVRQHRGPRHGIPWARSQDGIASVRQRSRGSASVTEHCCAPPPLS